MTQERRSRRRDTARQLETRLTKSPQCSSFHADGVWGGLTSKGQIVIGFFTEQFAIPDRVVYELPDTIPGNLKELSRQGARGVTREIQTQVFMNVVQARAMHSWLGEKLAQAGQLEEATRALADNGGNDAATPLVVESDDEDDD